MRAFCVYRRLNRIRFKGPPHFHGVAFLFAVTGRLIICGRRQARKSGRRRRALHEMDLELTAGLIVVRPVLAREPDRRAQPFQYFQILVKTPLGDAHLPGKFGRGARSFLTNELIQTEEKVKVLLHKRLIMGYRAVLNLRQNKAVCGKPFVKTKKYSPGKR